MAKLDEGYNSDQSDREITTKLTNIERDAEIFRELYFVEKLLHNSANGLIYTGCIKSSEKPVCIKQISRAMVDFVDWEERKVPREFYQHIKAARALPESVVQVYDWFERKTSFVLVMEYPNDYMDMFEFSRQYGPLDERPVSIIFSKVLDIVSRLSLTGVFHRDLKDENLLINPSSLELKLIDFGCATEWNAESTYTDLAGTPEFMAPEALEDGKYTAQGATLWSLGVLLFTLLHGYLPFSTDQKDPPKFRQDLSTEVIELLNKLLDKNPAERGTVEDTRSCQWLIK